MAILRRSFVVLFALSLIAAGCGDGDGGDASDAASAPDEGDAEDALDDLGNLSGKCADAAEGYLSAIGGVGGAMLGGAGDDLEKGAEALEKFADDAPSEIREDLQTVAAALSGYVKAMADIDFDPSSGEMPSGEAMEALEELSQRFDDEELTAASERVSAWFEEHCGTGLTGEE